MVVVLCFVPVVLSALVMGAHFLRVGNFVLVGASVGALGLMFVRRWWAARALQVLLLAAAGEWLWATARMTEVRLALGMPWMRLVIILGTVTMVTGLSALIFETRGMRRWFGRA